MGLQAPKGNFNFCHVSRQRSGSWAIGWPGRTLATVLNTGTIVLLDIIRRELWPEGIVDF